MSPAVLLFSELNKRIFGYFDPENIILQIIKINNFRGDLTDNSAKKEALVTRCVFIIADISVRSTQKQLTCDMSNNIYSIKVSQIVFNLIWKPKHWSPHITSSALVFGTTSFLLGYFDPENSF